MAFGLSHSGICYVKVYYGFIQTWQELYRVNYYAHPIFGVDIVQYWCLVHREWCHCWRTAVSWKVVIPIKKSGWILKRILPLKCCLMTIVSMSDNHPYSHSSVFNIFVIYINFILLLVNRTCYFYCYTVLQCTTTVLFWFTSFYSSFV